MIKKEKFEILLEEIKSDVKVSLEAHDLLNRKIDIKFNELDNKIILLAKAHNERFDKLEGRIGGLEGKMDGFEGRMGGLEGSINDLKIDLGSKISRVLVKIEDYENRIIVLEKKN